MESRSATIPVLEESAYKRFAAPVRAKGWNASTHVAELDLGTGMPENACVKLLYHDTWPALANEAIGHILARAVGLPGPERAGILVMDAAVWQRNLGAIYPSDAPREGLVPAWCASLQDSLADAAWIALSEDAQIAALLRSDGGKHVAAFDFWLQNVDRNPFNVLRLPRGKWAVIDHELLFNGVLGDWRRGHIDCEPDCYLWSKARALLRAGRITQREFRLIVSAMVEFAQRHRRAADESHPEISRIVSLIEGTEAASNVLIFIVDRSFAYWMTRHTGLLT